MRTPPSPEMTCGFLIQLVFCPKKKTMWFIGVELKQEKSAPPPKKNPGSAHDGGDNNRKTLVGTAKRWPRKLDGGCRFIKGRVADTAGKPSVKTSAN